MDTSNASLESNIVMESGYDLPVFDLDDRWFYPVHIVAIVCIFFSLISVITVLFLSFRLQNYKTFFSWTKSERFVVYLAICDGLFNVIHTYDHLVTTVWRIHIYPKELCQFYGFILAEFIAAQILMVNLIAISIFALVHRQKNINYGRRDWRLLSYTFGLPFIGGIIAGIQQQFGPNGLICFFDRVKGLVANFLFITVPMFTVLLVNTVLYILTWYKINKESKRLRNTLGNSSSTANSSHKVAQRMTMFVVAFFVQWFPLSLTSGWIMTGYSVPPILIFLTTMSSNSGGVYNGIVYFIIRRKQITRSVITDSELNHSEKTNN